MIFSISRHKKSFSEKEKSNMEPLVFNTSIAKKKPSNSDECPFCHLEQLTNIIDKNDGFSKREIGSEISVFMNPADILQF